MNPGTVSEIVVSEGRVYHLGLAQHELARNIFLAGDPARAERISKAFDEVEHFVSKREFVTYTGTYNGMPVSVIGTGIGTDNVEIALIELYVLNEFDLETKKRTGGEPLNIIRLGTSGGVQSDIEPGTQAIAAYGLGLDSTGVYYESKVPDEVSERIEKDTDQLLNDSIDRKSRFKGAIRSYVSKASNELVLALENAAEEAGLVYETGITVSAPGFYAPSSRNIAGIGNVVPSIKQTLSEVDVQGLRVLNMEMESSLLFHIASILGYRAATVCAVISGPQESDKLIDYNKTIGETIGVGLRAMTEAGDEKV